MIAHGTDTLSYSASALSFMLQGLAKTIVLTGSQIPMPYMASDGIVNMVEAIWAAAHSHIPEVVVVFNHKILRGNRSKKGSTSDMGSFRSPNLPPLGQFRTKGLQVQRPLLLPPGAALVLHKELATDLPIFKLSPRTNYDYILHQVTFDQAPGCVIEAYGSGTLPRSLEAIIARLI